MTSSQIHVSRCKVGLLPLGEFTVIIPAPLQGVRIPSAIGLLKIVFRHTCTFIMPPPRGHYAVIGVRPSVCLMSRTSALTRKPKGLGRRNFAQGYPRSHATPTPFKFGTHIGRGQFLPMDHKLAPSIQVKLKIASKEDHDSGVDP